MNASEAVTAAEDPFGAAPFRLPPGNHDSLISVLLTVDLTRFQSILLFGYLFLFFVFFCFAVRFYHILTTAGRKKLPVAALDGGN